MTPIIPQNPASTGPGKQMPKAPPAMRNEPASTHSGNSYRPGANVSDRDSVGKMAMNSNQANRPKYGSRNHARVPINGQNNARLDHNRHPQTTPSGQQYLFPAANPHGGMQQVNPYFHAQPEFYQNGTFQGMHPHMLPSTYNTWPVVYQGYDAPDNHSYNLGDRMRGAQPELAAPMPYHPQQYMPPVIDAVYQYGPLVPNVGQMPVHLQYMRTRNGYVRQDLDALTRQEPAIPRAVPAMWTNPSELTLAKCLENREGITNVYIRGFLPETTDEMLAAYAVRFGDIERCKAIVDLETGLCKGFGFVQYFTYESCENAIRGFHFLGYQASFAQKSRNSRLKDLEDRTSTNIYCTNIPIEWTEADLRRHFEPHQVVSEKISREEKTGMSKEVGFARFESREVAEQVLDEFHNVMASDGVKLMLRFADTKSQKMLKMQSNERRAYRAGEYNYSVEVVQGSTPSPTVQRMAQSETHLTPISTATYESPAGVENDWTPASSMSPNFQKHPLSNLRQTSSLSLNNLGENTPVTWPSRRQRLRRSVTDNTGSFLQVARPVSPDALTDTSDPSSTPQNGISKARSVSSVPLRMCASPMDFSPRSSL
ncbi:hypothetical protein N7466_008760 [Penicillium verhagenii]|uniref:uncharacterized protein n=1 Tax=Penicillium verhagenii TaxID=1562060 RepID=UPI002544ED24|nr:uncharacterized protein N7466_008760 [Penicillium verhagenii]KAJ5924573.1 hypothetical protein N7466_008760 [Penicillium verhagenii]